MTEKVFLVAFSDIHDNWDEFYEKYWMILNSSLVKYLVFCGDYQNLYGDDNCKFAKFINWVSKFPAKYKVMVWGNHDEFCWKSPDAAISLAKEFGVTILNHQSAKIGDLQFFGTPGPYMYTNRCKKYQEAFIDKFLEPFPKDVDVFLSHCPPNGIRDFNPKLMENSGSYRLRNHFNQHKPGLALFGHIHGQYGRDREFANVAVSCCSHKSLVHGPMVFDVSELEQKRKGLI